MRKSQRVGVVAGTIAALTGVGIAFAAWTSSGTATGTVTAATSKDLTVQVGAPVGLYPTGSVTIPVTVTNANDYRVQLDSIAFNGATVDKAGCTAATVTSTSGTYTDVAVPPGQSVRKDLTVSMSNAAEDACKNAVFTLGYTATGRSAG